MTNGYERDRLEKLWTQNAPEPEPHTVRTSTTYSYGEMAIHGSGKGEWVASTVFGQLKNCR